MTLVDSHCHLDSPEFDGDREAAIERALAAGVTHFVAVGTGSGPPDLEAGLRLAQRYKAFSATAGIHPHHAGKAGEDTLRRLGEVAHHAEIIAIGEIGLDYHYDFAPREEQRAVFASQLELAAGADLPVVIHTREAWDDTFEILESRYNPDGPGGVMHCFTGGAADAQRALQLGFYLSFGGIVTFPRASELQEVARTVPGDRMLLETDAPYLAPVPVRGKRNEPAFIGHTAAKLADLRGVTAGEIAAMTSANFKRLFRRAATRLVD